jgi:hypothetical protein
MAFILKYDGIAVGRPLALITTVPVAVLEHAITLTKKPSIINT